MAEARAQLAAAQASLDEARLNLSRTRISAPFDGRVRAKGADLGQYVGPGARLGRVFSTDRVQIRLPLTNAELAVWTCRWPSRRRMMIRSPGASERCCRRRAAPLGGPVVRTDSAIDPQTRTMSAIIEVADPYGAAAEAAGAPLAVGLFVSAKIDGRRSGLRVTRCRAARCAGPTRCLRRRARRHAVDPPGDVVDSSAERVVVTAASAGRPGRDLAAARRRGRHAGPRAGRGRRAARSRA
jgi:hypothetical protein